MVCQVDKRKVNDVCNILESNGLQSQKLGENGYQFKHPEGGYINVYYSGKVVIQGSESLKEKLNNFFKEKCGHLLEDQSEKAENMVLTFLVPLERINYLRQEIDRLCVRKGYEKKERTESNTYYRYSITDNANNKITITQYKTNKMLVQGLRTELWDQFTEFIGTELGLLIKTYVAQVLVEHNREIEVVDVLTDDQQEQARERIAQRLGECYDFLYDQDKCLIESSECILGINIKLNDYFAFISGTIKAMEGFIKKIVIQLGVFTEEEVRDHRRDFFGCLIDQDSKELNSKFDLCLSPEKQKVLRDFIDKVIRRIRHPYFHDGPPPVRQLRNLEDARSLHDELIGIMNFTFKKLRDELRL